MKSSADNHSKASAIESFYQEYIARTEELRAAIERQDWSDVRRFVSWREERLAELAALPTGEGQLNELHAEYLSRIMVLEAANINAVNDIRESLKSSIRATQERMRMVRYAANA